MSGKTEIKVYLPAYLVEKMEPKKQFGVRSKFIKEAIQEKYARAKTASPFDYEIIHLLSTARDKIRQESNNPGKYLMQQMIQTIIDELTRCE